MFDTRTPLKVTRSLTWIHPRLNALMSFLSHTLPPQLCQTKAVMMNQGGIPRPQAQHLALAIHQILYSCLTPVVGE